MSREKEIALFLTIAIAIWTVLNLYVFWRAASVPLVAQHIPRGALLAALVFLWASFLLAIVLDHLLGWEAIAAPFELIGTNWLGILFLLFCCLLSVDLITGFGLILPRLAPALRGGALLVGVLLCLIAFIQGFRPPVVRNYEVRLAGLPAEADGKVIVELSDLHLGAILGERWLQARIAQVESLRPDLVVIAGDFFEGHGQLKFESRMVPLLRRLTAPLGVWAVTGNHEFYGGLEGSSRLLESAGIHVLHNEWKEVRPGLVIAGVDDTGNHRFADDEVRHIQRALAGRPAGTATVFVSHRPQGIEEAARAGAGLMLAGHTHGGQIWPFNYVVRYFIPLVGGRYEVGGMPVIVCRGTGLWGPRMRLWRPGEIVLVTLRSPFSVSQGASMKNEQRTEK
ncbi:MAG: metallophosphoesterase [bacterium]|nr:metallophosphoesterase [bacterium]